MPSIIQALPGSQVTILHQILNGDGERVDGYSLPFISKLILPDLSESTLYPLDMIRLDTGLYYHRLLLNSGAIAIGTYIFDISYTDENNNEKSDYVQVICSSPGGQFSISPG